MLGNKITHCRLLKKKWNSPKARPMRIKVHGYILTKDTCMAIGDARNNKNLGDGGTTQYFIENRGMPNLADTGLIIAYGNQECILLNLI